MKHSRPKTPWRAGPSMREFLAMPEGQKDLVRRNLVAQAYANLPDLTPQERELARSKALAAEAGLWRIRYDEAVKVADGHERRADLAEEAVERLSAKLQTLIESVDLSNPAESPAASTT